MSITIEIKVIPRSGRQQFTMDLSGTIKCFLKSAPVGGKANAELIKFISKLLKIPQDCVAIVQGAKSRKKRIKIDVDLEPNEILGKLGIEVQMSL